MVLRLLILLLSALIAFGISPAAAHKAHQEKDRLAAEQKAATGPQPGPAVSAAEAGGGPAEAGDRPGTAARALDWVGRFHPFATHFPVALFPVAWILLIRAGRRGGGVDVIRAIIIIAGASALAAALLGWINAGFLLRDSDALIAFHRWLGTALGVTCAGLALWAWRRPGSVATPAMARSLGIVTLALLVQGWLGGALVHGVDHLNW